MIHVGTYESAIRTLQTASSELCILRTKIDMIETLIRMNLEYNIGDDEYEAAITAMLADLKHHRNDIHNDINYELSYAKRSNGKTE